MTDIQESTFRSEISKAEKLMLDSPDQIHVEPVHRFAEGLYCRELTMPKDTIWVSRVHKHENFAFVMTGSCSVVSEHGIELVTAPCMFKTMAGTKRLLKIHEESTWVTVHALPAEMGQDMDQLEDYFTCVTLEEYDQFLIEEQRKLEVLL
jgi:hypothetical protein